MTSLFFLCLFPYFLRLLTAGSMVAAARSIAHHMAVALPSAVFGAAVARLTVALLGVTLFVAGASGVSSFFSASCRSGVASFFSGVGATSGFPSGSGSGSDCGSIAVFSQTAMKLCGPVTT